MHKIICLLIVLFTATTASAEFFVCQRDVNPIQRNHLFKRKGDCMKLGLCSGFNNTGLDSNCIIATKEQYDSVGQFKKLDNGSIVEMTQSEKNAILQAEADAKAQDEQNALDKFDVSNLEIITALVQRINARIPANPITKQEIIDQIKANR